MTNNTSLPLAGTRMLAFTGEIYEDLELWYPKLRLIEAGCEVVVAGPEAGGKYAGKNGYPCVSDVAIADCDAASFDALLVPGGFMPDKLRRDPKVLSIVREFDDAKKPIAATVMEGGFRSAQTFIATYELLGRPGLKTISLTQEESTKTPVWWLMVTTSQAADRMTCLIFAER